MKKALPSLAVLLFLGLLLWEPDTASAAVQRGLLLCYRSVIPSLFPFFVASGLLLRLGAMNRLQHLCAPLMGPLFHLPGICAAPLLTGLSGGYPTGAKTVVDLYGQKLLTRQQAEAALSFVNNCGPAFLLSYVGIGIFGSSRVGVQLFLIHTLSALLTGMILCRAAGCKGNAPTCRPTPPPGQPLTEALPAAVTGALHSTLQICAFVALFQVIAAFLPHSLPCEATGVLEMATGVSLLPADAHGFIAAAGIVSWGGLSVHCQTLSVLGTSDLSPRWHWLGKAMQAVLALLLAAAVTVTLRK